jgi:hypothetical protein
VIKIEGAACIETGKKFVATHTLDMINMFCQVGKCPQKVQVKYARVPCEVHKSGSLQSTRGVS